MAGFKIIINHRSVHANVLHCALAKADQILLKHRAGGCSRDRGEPVCAARPIFDQQSLHTETAGQVQHLPGQYSSHLLASGGLQRALREHPSAPANLPSQDQNTFLHSDGDSAGNGRETRPIAATRSAPNAQPAAGRRGRTNGIRGRRPFVPDAPLNTRGTNR